jgi:hypothetical protein
MKKLNFKYLKNLISITTFLFLLTLAVFFTEYKIYFNPAMISALFYIVFTSLFFHYRVSSAMNRSVAQFNATFMATIALKLLSNIIFIVVYLLFIKENTKSFVLYYLFLYFIFLFFDIKEILFELKKK